MNPYATTPRQLALGWIRLAQSLAAAHERRRPAFASTEPVVFRSECFAEDLLEASARPVCATGRAARHA